MLLKVVKTRSWAMQKIERTIPLSAPLGTELPIALVLIAFHILL